MRIIQVPTAAIFAPLFQSRARYKSIKGGRGSGKSHVVASYVIEKCLLHPGLRVVCAREVQKSLRQSVKRLLTDRIEELGLAHLFQFRLEEIRTPGGGTMIFVGLSDQTAEAIKSLEGFNLCWVEEAQTLSVRSLELLRPTIRAPGSEIIFTRNPRNPDDAVDVFMNASPPDAIEITANYCDNPWFPAELEAERQHDELHKPNRYAHIWRGAHQSSTADALWKEETIESCRKEAPELARTLVSVDHAVSDSDTANEHGIIVVAKGVDGHAYVLEDNSVQGSPATWAKKAIETYDRLQADAIVLERNQGGDLVRNTLLAIRPVGLRIIEVTATRGKHVRAEPVATLYVQGKVHHVKPLPELEQQMTRMSSAGYDGKGSPDRLDALVWGLSSLFPSLQKEQEEPENTHFSREKSWMS